MGLIAIAGIWGFAEATLFFIVPDVFITWAATRGLRGGLLVALTATLGALCGGVLMYVWGYYNSATALTVLDWVPAISHGMIASVHTQLETAGFASLFVGPLTGTPYKIYAVQAGSLGLNPILFMLISIPARLVRFVLLALLTAGVRRWLISNWPQHRVNLLLFGLWSGFYILFFSLMPN